MRQDTAVILGTPAVGAVVFGTASMALVISSNPDMVGPAFGSGLIVGWLAGRLALPGILHPELKIQKKFESHQPVVFNIPQADGFIARVSGGDELPLEYWQAVAVQVVTRRAKNLTQQIIRKALPTLVQGDQRDIHAQIIGLLSNPVVGVIVQKNNHNEITHPEGWKFFARVAAGRIGVFNMFGLPYSPQHKGLSQIADFTQHTRATRAIFGAEKGWSIL